MKRFFYAVMVVSLCCSPAFGARTNRYVATNGAHIPPFNTWERASTSINVAVAWANTNNQGDIVYVSNGTYRLTQSVLVSNTVVQGWTKNYNDVIVDGQKTVRCFHLANTKAVLSGVTITNGEAAGAAVLSGYGGGVVMYSAANVYQGVLSNCLVTGCRANYGGGVASYYPKGLNIQGCVIERNTANSAGGIQWYYGAGDCLVKDCVLRYNLATNGAGAIGVAARLTLLDSKVISNKVEGGSGEKWGGGITVGSQGDGPSLNRPIVISNCFIMANSVAGSASYVGGVYVSAIPCKLYNCLIAGNSSYYRGGLHFRNSAATGEVYNCTIVGNTASQSEDTQKRGAGVSCENSTSVLANCVIYSNVYSLDRSQDNYSTNNMGFCFTNCCTYPMPTYGANNITDPPRLVAPPWDFRLAPDSPCINSGTNLPWTAQNGVFDLDGRRRIDGFFGLVDMGAYEFLPSGSMIKFR